MTVAVREMIPVQAPRADAVHITSLATPGRTACGKSCDGWHIEPRGLGAGKKRSWRVTRRHVTCLQCKAIVFKKVRR